VHFTRGGPWFAEWKGVEYAAEWQACAASQLAPAWQQAGSLTVRWPLRQTSG
jgi:hypothetical protein